ncbi:GMC family oxidoreductase [Aspergillus ibericus CBS 121593]|uniref:Alcohol oxidase n=1 Tax=Aspergillus ibericus CBS 121593 TaxID=1448316 RepID=A0A395GVF1_9EURO|nr:alcohol oxidase [Aspergillus ibericus CBS 121593]RAK98988.1 alcohol oxidase [Aspergillus ibericus CBS 121593]
MASLSLRVAGALLLQSFLTTARPLGSSFGYPANATYDYVVVGAGNAGAGLSYRLAEAGYSVALVEAGSFYEISNGNLTQVPGDDVYWCGKEATDTNSLIDWDIMTTPQAGLNNASTHYTRGKTLGGNTARNYMTYQIATNASYQMWADMVGDDSYTYENFLPYFQKHMHFTPPDNATRFANSTPAYDLDTMGTEGPVSVTFPNYAGAFATWVAKGWKELGAKAIDGFTSGRLIGYSYSLATIQADNQQRETSETAYLQPAIAENLNLIIYQSTLAKQVLFDSSKKATGVRVVSAGQEYFLSASREVVVSAGAFQSPQLLMVSGIGPSALLEKYDIPVLVDSPGVGQNMQDHILFGPAYRVNLVTGSSVKFPEYLAAAIEGYNSQPPTGILTNPGNDIIAWEKIPSSLRSNFSSTAQTALAQYPSDWPEVEYIHIGGYFGNQENFVQDAPQDSYNYVSIASALITPLSRGTVEITSADTADLPAVNPNWLTDPTDVEVSIAAFKRARQLMNTTALSSIVIGEEYFPGPSVQTDEEIVAWLRVATNTVFHASCTCAMGNETNPLSVIDSKARVYGVSGLRVVDASSFPILVPGHPMSTIYALAEKIAEDIIQGN